MTFSKHTNGALKAFAAVLVLCLVVIAPARLHDARGQQIIQKIEALVNDEAITAYDVGQRMGLVLLATGQQISSQEDLMQLRQQVLETLINEKLEVQEAKEYEVPVPDEEIYAVYDRVARSYNRTPDNFDQLLQQYGTSTQALVQQIEAEYAWQTLVNGRYNTYVAVNDQEIDQLLEEMKANAGKQEYRLSEIYLIVNDPSQDERVKATAQRIRDQMESAYQFGEMARQFSQSTTSAQGGDLGWVTQDQMRPEVYEAIKDMNIFDVSQPIKTSGGYYLVALTDRRKILATDPLDELLRLRQIGWFFTADTTQEEALEWYDDAEKKVAAFDSCQNLDTFVNSLGEVVSRDLGEIALKQLNPELRDIIGDMEPNSATPPINTPDGFMIFVVCGRRMPETSLPDPEVLQQQIETQRISLMARRYLRDLRRDAIIEYK